MRGPATGSLLRWGWLLGVALLVPAGLPAGGAERRQPQIRRRAGADPLLSGFGDVLRASPCAVAPALRTLPAGTPLQPLRRWRCGAGIGWLQVWVCSGDGCDDAPAARRGWIHG